MSRAASPTKKRATTLSPARLLETATLLLVAWCVACGGSQFDGRVFQEGDLHFRVGPIPSTWRRLEAEPALLAYRDDQKSATIMLGGRCHRDGDEVPLHALTQHLFLQFTERDVRSQKLVQMDRREALRTEISAKLDGAQNHFVAYVLKKDSCVYDFVHITDEAPANVADFERFVSGFSTQ